MADYVPTDQDLSVPRGYRDAVVGARSGFAERDRDGWANEPGYVRTGEAAGFTSFRVRRLAERVEEAELLERMAELELAAEDSMWLREASWNDRDFSRDGLKRILRLARLSYLKNPLIQRGVNVQAYYVWGQGVDCRAVDDTVNEVVQAFLDDKANQSELTSHEARVAKEKELQVTGNLFFTFFTRPASGKVRVRSIPVDEVLAIICNPDDQQESWFYKRQFAREVLNPLNGNATTDVQVAYYPDWRYDPPLRVPFIGDAPVHWDIPVYHVKVGGLRDMRFGVPEVYAALDWARAVKADLEDYATVKRALSRFAWNLTTKGGAKGVQAAKTRFNTTVGSSDPFVETNPPPLVGSTFISGESTQMAPIRTAGMQPSADEGRRLWLMVASALGLPETFFGEASVGSHATAKTLDRPTELKMRDRQVLWSDVLKDILQFVVERSATAPGGALDGGYETDADGERRVTLGIDPATGEERDRLIEVNFPPMLERDALQRVGAVVQASTLNGFPSAGVFDKRTLTQLLLQALGEDDIDQLLDRLAPNDGEPLVPPTDLPAEPPKPAAGSAASTTNSAAATNPTRTKPNELGQPRATSDPSEAFVEALRELRAAVRGIV